VVFDNEPASVLLKTCVKDLWRFCGELGGVYPQNKVLYFIVNDAGE